MRKKVKKGLSCEEILSVNETLKQLIKREASDSFSNTPPSVTTPSINDRSSVCKLNTKNDQIFSIKKKIEASSKKA